VKNIESIVMGKYHMSTWYYSPLPSEYNQYNVLHFCNHYTLAHMHARTGEMRRRSALEEEGEWGEQCRSIA